MHIDSTRLLEAELMRAGQRENAWPGTRASQMKFRLETERSGGRWNLVGEASDTLSVPGPLSFWQIEPRHPFTFVPPEHDWPLSLP
jgi:hypothetical protein